MQFHPFSSGMGSKACVIVMLISCIFVFQLLYVCVVFIVLCFNGFLFKLLTAQSHEFETGRFIN